MVLGIVDHVHTGRLDSGLLEIIRVAETVLSVDVETPLAKGHLVEGGSER